MIALENGVSLEIYKMESVWSVWVSVNSITTLRIYPRTITFIETDENDPEAMLLLKFDNFADILVTREAAYKIKAITKN